MWISYFTRWKVFESIIIFQNNGGSTCCCCCCCVGLLLLDYLLLLFSHQVLSDSFATPWTVTYQAPLSMGFPRQENWSGLPCPPPQSIFPTQGSNSGLLNCRQILYHLSHQGRWDLKWITVPWASFWASQVELVVKNLPVKAGDIGDSGLICVRKIPWRREWLPTPVFLPGESHGQRKLVGYNPWVAN